MTCTLMNSMELLKLCKCRYHSLHHFVLHNECSSVVNATKLRGVTGYFEYIGKIQKFSLGLHTYTEVLVSEQSEQDTLKGVTSTCQYISHPKLTHTPRITQ